LGILDGDLERDLERRDAAAPRGDLDLERDLERRRVAAADAPFELELLNAVPNSIVIPSTSRRYCLYFTINSFLSLGVISFVAFFMIASCLAFSFTAYLFILSNGHDTSSNFFL